MSILSYTDNQFEEDSMAYVFSKKKEAYRVNIRKSKLNHTLSLNRLKTNIQNDKSIQLLQTIISSQESQFASEHSNSINITRESIQQLLSQSSFSDNLIQKILLWFRRMISSFQKYKQKDLSLEQLEEIKQQIVLIVDIEQMTQTQIIELNDISFVLRLIGDNQIPIQKKLLVIEILGVMYGSQGIKQNVIQYFIQYLRIDNLSIIDKILDFFQLTLVSETEIANVLSTKLNKPFFVKLFFYLLNLKCEKISLKILNIASQLIKHDQDNKFLNDLIENKSMFSKLLYYHLELKNKDLILEIKELIYKIIIRIQNSNEEIVAYIQSLIDSNLINKLFEIFNAQSFEYPFLRQLIILIFSKSNHFQIEHYFDQFLKHFIINHTINYLTISSNDNTLLILQLIHQILFEEKEFNQQNYYPRKILIQSLEINAFIDKYLMDENENICNEAKFISNYL